ncbi:MAG TPA: hypothetical protein VHG28_13060 [Longimicrobiaceae bacterium]|nr:hypothetical protein [Longimicrobiaceae bacterium]
MNAGIRGISRLALGAALLTGAGCAQLGTMEDILGGVMSPTGGGNNGELVGEIRYVDTRNQRIELRTQDGRTAALYYDGRTQVVYRQQEYPVTALEQGDYVSARVQQGSQRELYTDYIYVQQSVQDRGGQGGHDDRTGGIQRTEGTVGTVDYSRGTFILRERNGSTVQVSLPYGASRSDVDRFRRLRNGDYVRLEVQALSQTRVELYRFLN